MFSQTQQFLTVACFCGAVILVISDVDLEFADVVVDVIQVSHHHSLVLHHVVQHGQPVGELCPGLVELSQSCRFRLGTS